MDWLIAGLTKSILEYVMKNQHHDKDWLIEHYIIQQLSTHQIAKLADCSKPVINKWLQYHNIPIRSSVSALKIRLQDPAYRSPVQSPEQRSIISKLNWQDPTYRVKTLAAVKLAVQTPENSNKVSKAVKRYFQNQEARTRVSKIIIKRITDGKLHSNCKNGWHESPKAGLIHYRSSWELLYYQRLDDDNSVLRYETESLIVPYCLDGIDHNYVPDILVWYIDGHKELIEIKPSKQLGWPKNIVKIMAAQAYCKQNKIVFVVVTEHDLKAS